MRDPYFTHRKRISVITPYIPKLHSFIKFKNGQTTRWLNIQSSKLGIDSFLRIFF